MVEGEEGRRVEGREQVDVLGVFAQHGKWDCVLRIGVSRRGRWIEMFKLLFGRS
jgi:hypothetical protein